MSSAIKTPWSSVGYLVMKRTYARRLNENNKDSPTEEWIDICLRVIDACQSQLKVGFTTAEQGRLFDYMMKLKGTVAGRFLWQLGTSTVERLGLPSLQNCAFTSIDHPIRPFTWAFDMLMLGCFSPETKIVTKNGLKDISEVTTDDLLLTVNPDTGEEHYQFPDRVWETETENKPKVRIEFDNGTFVDVTEDHLFLTIDRGWVSAKDLTEDDDIKESQSWRPDSIHICGKV